MLPQFMDNSKKCNNVIYINPHFRKNPTNELTSQSAAHINPLFLERHKAIQITNIAPKIHMNPSFLTKKLSKQETIVKEYDNLTSSMPTTSTTTTHIEEPMECSALPASNNIKSLEQADIGKIVSESHTRIEHEKQLAKCDIDKKVCIDKSAVKPMIILSKQKLIRNVLETTTVPAAGISDEKSVAFSSKSKYKLIKCAPNLPLNTVNLKVKDKNNFVQRYALRRAITTNTQLNDNDCISENKKVQLLNINGVFYNSTKNTLKRKELFNKSLKTFNDKENRINSPTSLTGALTIHIKGTKYIMDAQKYKLTRISTANINAEDDTNNNNGTNGKQSITMTTAITQSTVQPISNATTVIPRRIDIGGVTYISDVSSTNNVFERTTNHLTRAYINNAKQKSLHTLSKRLVKCNVPCPIYQFVGKCAAYERGKCSKLHDKLQVKVCSRFLRGECVNRKCLLSHNVCLEKMPVCKFFLEGQCGRDDCPYLHKKLSNDAEICVNFLRGFCQLADKCNKRHEFVCREYERNGKYCMNIACIYCKRNRKKLIAKNAQRMEYEKLGKPIQAKTINLPCKDDDNNRGYALPKDKNEENRKSEKDKMVDVVKHQIRYFTERQITDDVTAASLSTTTATTVISSATSTCITSSSNTNVSDDNNELEIDANGRRVRKKLGPLPSFIPLN